MPTRCTIFYLHKSSTALLGKNVVIAESAARRGAWCNGDDSTKNDLTGILSKIDKARKDAEDYENQQQEQENQVQAKLAAEFE